MSIVVTLQWVFKQHGLILRGKKSSDISKNNNVVDEIQYTQIIYVKYMRKSTPLYLCSPYIKFFSLLFNILFLFSSEIKIYLAFADTHPAAK